MTPQQPVATIAGRVCLTFREAAALWFGRQRLLTFFREHKRRVRAGEIRKGGW